MKRSTFLLLILALLALVALPISYMDQTLGKMRSQAEGAQNSVSPLLKQIAAVKEQDQKLADRLKAMDDLRKQRLVPGSDAFVTIQALLTGMAQRSGIAINGLSLKTGAAVPDLPGVIRYDATLQISGSRQQFLAFLQQLESSPQLIDVPEVTLNLPANLPPIAATPSKAPEVQMSLTLGFFGAQK